MFRKNNLNEFLKLLLAESINSQEKTLSAQIREVQRCLAVFDQKGWVFSLRCVNVFQYPKAAAYIEGRAQAPDFLFDVSSTVPIDSSPVKFLSKQAVESSKQRKVFGRGVFDRNIGKILNGKEGEVPSKVRVRLPSIEGPRRKNLPSG